MFNQSLHLNGKVYLMIAQVNSFTRFQYRKFFFKGRVKASSGEGLGINGIDIFYSETIANYRDECRSDNRLFGSVSYFASERIRGFHWNVFLVTGVLKKIKRIRNDLPDGGFKLQALFQVERRSRNDVIMVPRFQFIKVDLHFAERLIQQ